MQRVTRRFVFAIAAPLLCAALGGSGRAQAPTTPGTTRTVNLTLEQRHVIRELVKELLKAAPAAEDFKLAAGDVIPDKVALQPVPPLIGQKVPSIRSYRLYVTPRQIFIVDPQDQKVVEVIE